jgi:hypothetical protein
VLKRELKNEKIMKKVGRNDPCPCGSGKKYKKCHPGEYDPESVLMRAMPTMPICGCWIADDYESEGLSPVFIVRQHSETGRLVIASFMCDIFCLGVKDVLFEPNATEDRLDFLLEMQPQDMAEISYESAREIILGAVKYAESLGFTPHVDYEKAKYAIEYERPFRYKVRDYGVEGKPFYVTGPNDNYEQVFATLEKNVGKGNFEYEILDEAHFHYDG